MDKDMQILDETVKPEIHRKEAYLAFKEQLDKFNSIDNVLNVELDDFCYYYDMQTLLLVIESYQDVVKNIGDKLHDMRKQYNQLQKAHLLKIKRLNRVKSNFEYYKMQSELKNNK